MLAARRVRVSEDLAGQRLDNFLLRELAGLSEAELERYLSEQRGD